MRNSIDKLPSDDNDKEPQRLSFQKKINECTHLLFYIKIIIKYYIEPPRSTISEKSMGVSG